MQLYPGTNPVTIIVSPTDTPSGTGIWPTPDVLTTDTLSAANLMTAVESVTDRTNWLGWRVRSLDVINGVALALATHTAAIYNRNDWRWIGNVEVINNGSTMLGSLRIKAPAYVQDGKTLNVGVAGAGNEGHILVVNGDIYADNGQDIGAINGGRVYVDGASTLVVEGGGRFGNAGNVTQNDDSRVYHPWRKLGDDAYTVERTDDVASGATIDGFTVDTARSTNVGNTGGIAVPHNFNLSAPPNGSALGVRVHVYASQGTSTSGTTGDTAFIQVTAGGVQYLGWSQIDGSGKTAAPCYVTLHVVSAGGSARKWEAIACSGLGP